MRRAVLAALAASALAFGMAAPPPVQAAAEPSRCTGATCGREVIDQPIAGGDAQLYCLCTPDGWMLIGATYCVGGDCSSD